MASDSRCLLCNQVGVKPCPECGELAGFAAEELGVEHARRFMHILAESFDIEVRKLRRDSTFAEDLNADSLEVVETTMKLEETFDVTISEEEQSKITTLGDVVLVLARAMAAKRDGK
jgi:acyl carrier protein